MALLVRGWLLRVMLARLLGGSLPTDKGKELTDNGRVPTDNGKA